MDNFTFIVLTIIVAVFGLGMSFRKVQVWKKSGKVLESYIQNGVGSLIMRFSTIMPIVID